MDIKEIRLEGVECIFVAEGSDKWLAVLNDVLILVSEELQIFLLFTKYLLGY
jgi:hypothetical protein